MKPATIHDVGGVSRAEFVLDEVFTDAAAIFLPTFTNVSRLGYGLGAD